MFDKIREKLDQISEKLTPLTRDGLADNHLVLSMVKSCIRIFAGFLLLVSGVSVFVVLAGFFLIVAEMLGVLEELV